MKRLAQCHCGSLRAKTSGDPLMVSLCQCRDCQRSTGAVAGSGAVFEKAEVTTEGKWKLFERAGADGRKVRFRFCPNCGTSLYWEGNFNPNLRIVAVGAFADPTFPAPLVSVYERSRHDWLQLPDGMARAQRGLVSLAATVDDRPLGERMR
ncbi:GFA family protein [Rhizobium sp. MC63]|uniref:GFA family protein n=1 Tax=Rhizobium mulingense TaxID=3031128 RepID=A0ACC6N1S1_9HYPH|nr:MULTISPECIES: GFA family protein [unclassified Rhizobium]MDF0699306.1 GFA family protein [Rhizobium sp. MC63]MEA3519624.1 GFA family protein [Rhizobium sp. MJ31]